MINEISNSTLASYLIKAASSKVKHERKASRAEDAAHDSRISLRKFSTHYTDAYKRSVANHERRSRAIMKFHDKVAYNRERGMDRAANKMKMDASLFREENLQERVTLADPSKYFSTNLNATKSHNVVQSHTQREKNMYDTNRTAHNVRRGFRTADYAKNRSNTLGANRYDIETRNRISTFKKSISSSNNIGESLKNALNMINEDSDYMKNRKSIHDMHAEIGNTIARSNRDPELKRINKHRADKHAHASMVLEKLIALNSKKKK